jgi:hypothetical protein
MTKTIQQLIDESLIRPERERSGKWSPSSFGYCYRNQYWNRKNEPQSNPPDERNLRVFAVGQLFHDFVQNIICPKHLVLPDFGDKKGREVLIESDDVKGFADIVTPNEVIEIKSQHSKSFWYMAKYKGDDIKKEKYSNWLQVGYYARELEKQFMRLVFVSKDDLCIQEYVQPLDDYWLNEIYEELQTLRYLWEQEELPLAEPRCEPNKNGEFWQCTYCAWQNKCKEIEAKKCPMKE